MMYFTNEQFVVGLHLPIPSLFKQFFHFTQIPLTFLHPNVVRVLMGCSVLDMLFQPRMKISVITDISVFRFYGYIGYIGDISVDILEKNIGKLKIVKNS